MIGDVMVDDRADISMKPLNAGAQVIALGASAGGLRALSTILSGLPCTFPGAVVIVLHISTHAPSTLASLLRAARRCPSWRLPAESSRAREWSMPRRRTITS